MPGFYERWDIEVTLTSTPTERLAHFNSTMMPAVGNHVLVGHELYLIEQLWLIPERGQVQLLVNHVEAPNLARRSSVNV